MPVYKACIGQPGATIKMSVDDYDRRYGKNNHIHPFCPVCNIQLFTHAVSSLNMMGSFHHPKGNPNSCPLVNRQDGVFSPLEACHFDETKAAVRRDAFHQGDNIKRAYVFMLSMCGKGNLRADQFSKCVKTADAMNIWAYKNLQHRFVLKKERGCSRAYWQTPDTCSLVKGFSDSGNPVKSANNPAQISEHFFIDSVIKYTHQAA